jgi:hypothetical protein
MTYKATQSWKKSKPVLVDNIWRIRRHDGELMGYYATKELAQRSIDTSGWIL